MRLFLAVLCCAMPVVAAAQEGPPKKIASVEGVTEYRLANGARVLLFPERTKPTITVNMTVLVGSRHEGYGEAGMAHLLEHMVFKGTPTFPDVPTALRDHGANFNGTTNRDRTNYFETLPADDSNLEFAIKLECDRLVNSYIKNEDLQSEFTVVRNEFERSENSPSRVLSNRVMSAAYEWHNYGKTTIGNRSDIEKVPVENLKAFYRKYYQPDNVVLIVTGRFEEKRGLELVNKYLGSIPRPERKLNADYTVEPPQDGERKVELRRVGKIGSVMAAYHVPAAGSDDYAPLTILASVLSEDKVGLLQQKLVESDMATSVFARSDNAHDPGLFSVSVQPSEGYLEQAREELLKTLDKLGDETFTKEAVDRAKKRQELSAERLMFDANRMASALSSASALGDWRLLFVQRDRLQKVTVDDVKRVAATYFVPHNRTVGTFVPTDSPKRAAIPMVASLSKIVDKYKGGAAVEAGEAFDATPENLAARVETLEMNGLNVGLLQKKNRGNTVNMTINLRYGNEQSLNGKTTAAAMVSSMLMAGTKTKDRQALQARMAELGVRIGGGGGRGRGRRRRGGGGGGSAGSLGFSISAKRESLVPAIELLGEILREPAFPSDFFNQMKRRMVGGAKRGLDEPGSKASNMMSRTLSRYPKSDVRYVPTTEESIEMIENLSLDDVIAVYNDQVGSTTGQVAIVGDFDKDATLTALSKIVQDWNTSVPFRSIERDAKADVAGMKKDILTPDKANATFMAGHSFNLKEDDPDTEALLLGNFIFGGSTLSSRIGNRIRQKEGLSYGATSSVRVPSRGTDARFTMSAITNPMNMDAVEKAALEELEMFLKDGPTEQEVADAKNAWLERQKVSRSNDGSIAGQIISNLYLGRTFEFTAKREKRISDLTPTAIRDAFRKHVDPKKLVILRAGDL